MSAPDTVAPAPDESHPAYRRVLLKLSGEVFGGGRTGVDPDVVKEIAGQIAAAVTDSVQVAIVVGGDFLEKAGVPTRVQTAITMGQVAEAYIPLRAIRHMEKGRVVIFGAGAGMPYFSTDTVSAQRALETHCDRLLIAKSGVDGIYTADPKIDPTATKIEALTFADALGRGLKILDAAAFALCAENRLPMLVFGMEGEGNITRALRGERIGTLVTAG